MIVSLTLTLKLLFYNLFLFIAAVQHERKPIIDKKEFSSNADIKYNYQNNSEIKFNQSAVNAIKTAVDKIFIRKDLNTESGLIPNPFCSSELGLQFLNKRISKYIMYFNFEILI